MSLGDLQAFCANEGFPRYTARQLCDWMYKKKVSSFDAMTNLSLQNRARLNEVAQLGRSLPVEQHTSADGTCKYLFLTQTGAGDGSPDATAYVETVFIPAEERGTLCVSCQRGCKMGCRFCVTGKQGFHGSLTAGDILNQLFSVPESDQLTNVVFMGMGEPMDNYEAVMQAITVLTADWGWGWSPHRITVSTVGVIPQLQRFLDDCDCHLAVSLHNAFPEERLRMMPMEKSWPIADVVALLKTYNWYGQRRLSFEYTMFKGINDDLTHAAELATLLRGLRCRVNLIRYHHSPDSPYESSSESTMTTFRDYLSRHNIIATIRASRGEDIMAACGLLAGTPRGE